MSWRPRVARGVWVGIAVLALIVVVDVGLVRRVMRGPPNGITFLCGFAVVLSLAPTAVIAYRVYDLTQLRYEFDRNRLAIVRAGTRHIIPLQSIERVVEAGRAGLGARIRSIRWPGCYLGPGSVDEIGLTLFSGVTPPREQLIVVTPVLAYGITVRDIEVFQQVFAACRQLGMSAEVRHESVQSPFVQWSIWRDRIAHGLVGGGILLSALLFAVLLFRYPALPERLPMHYDAARLIDRIGPRSEAFDLPVIGLITWATNGVLGMLFYRRQRMISYLAWSGTLAVQTLFLMALWDMVT